MSINAEMVLDQKQSPGLIEVPCMQKLIELAAEVPKGQAVVELGAFKGRSTALLALGVERGGKGVPVYSVDPWEAAEPLDEDYLRHAKTVAEYQVSETRLAYEAHLENSGARPFVTTVQATAVDAAATYGGPPVALLWHDALHRLEDVRDDLKAWLPHLADKAVVMLHDVGDPTFGVEAGAKAAVGRRKGWDFEGREIHVWAKQPTKRGFCIIRKG